MQAEFTVPETKRNKVSKSGEQVLTERKIGAKYNLKIGPAPDPLYPAHMAGQHVVCMT